MQRLSILKVSGIFGEWLAGVLGVSVWECQIMSLGGGLWSEFKRSDVSDRELGLCPVSFNISKWRTGVRDLNHSPFLGQRVPGRSSPWVRNATIMLMVFYSLPRQMVPQSLNDVEAVFLHKSDGYCNLLGASAFHQDSVFFFHLCGLYSWAGCELALHKGSFQ